MYIVSISNKKGGVGKTSMTVNLASEFAQKDWRVLVIDMDEQCNTTNFYHGNRRDFKGNISMILDDGVSTSYCIEKLSATLHLIPGSPDIKYLTMKTKPS